MLRNRCLRRHPFGGCLSAGFDAPTGQARQSTAKDRAPHRRCLSPPASTHRPRRRSAGDKAAGERPQDYQNCRKHLIDLSWKPIASPSLRDHSAGSGLDAAHRGRVTDRRDSGAGAFFQMCRTPAAVSAAADLSPPRPQSASLNFGRLAWPCRLPTASGARVPARTVQRGGLAVRRWDERARPRCPTRAYQDRAATAYANGDRLWGGRDPSGVAYVKARDLQAERPIAPLPSRWLRILAERGNVQFAFCWSRVRRRFYELAAASLARSSTSRDRGSYGTRTFVHSNT